MTTDKNQLINLAEKLTDLVINFDDIESEDMNLTHELKTNLSNLCKRQIFDAVHYKKPVVDDHGIQVQCMITSIERIQAYIQISQYH